MNNTLLSFAQKMINSNRDKIPNTPWASSAINAIMNGDDKAGADIANNLCKSYGEDPKDVLNKAAKFFTS